MLERPNILSIINSRSHFGRTVYLFNLMIYCFFVAALTTYILSIEGYYNTFHNHIQLKGFDPSADKDGPLHMQTTPLPVTAIPINETIVSNLSLEVDYIHRSI